MIEFQNVVRSYGQKLAVADLSMKIPAGRLFALLGPNGAGKTTTIKMLVGLLQPSSGSVRVCGHDVARQSREASRLLGFVPDEVFLYEKLSGREFLDFVADLHGLNRREAATRIAAQIDAFELAGFVDDRSETYSHGMKQRLALAAALLHDPAVLVLDEPMVGLDPRSMRLVKNILQRRTAAGMCVFMSTHSLSLAEEIADLIGVVDGGKLMFLGTLAELRGQAAHGHTTLEDLYLALTASDDERLSTRRVALPESDSGPPAAGEMDAGNDVATGARKRVMSTAGATVEIAASLESHGGELLAPEREAQVFWSLRRRLVRASLRRLFRTARLRAALVVLLSIVFWGALYFLFYSGFDLLSGLYPLAVPSLYNAFFASLMVMLLFSSGVIMYTNLYRSPEAAFLLTTPARPGKVFSYLFQEALWFSSWGFLLLGSPMLVAAGVVAQAPWHYYALLLPFMLSFLYIPAALGAILCLLIVDRLGRIPWATVRWVAVLAAAGLLWLGWSVLAGGQTDLLTPRWFQELSERLRFTEIRLLPSSWLSTGLLEAIRRPMASVADDRPWSESIMYLSLLISNALVAHQLAVWFAGRVYRGSFSRMQTAQASRRRIKIGVFDRLLLSRLGGSGRPPSHLRLLFVKELRLFRRDPVQWSQSLIFFGLLALYFINIRRFSYNVAYSAMIGFLNLGVVGLILSTFTTRFVFPMLSLEGRRFWILALSPVRRDTVVWTKFAFAAGGSLLPCCGLMLLSDAMLDISWPIMWVHQLSCAMLCLGLSGIAVGLGAKMPELREQNPSKIAAGFGGTLNLVLSAVYIVAIVILTAVPFHFYLMSVHGLASAQSERITRFLGNPPAIAAGIALTILVGLIATIWPMRIGLRAFRQMDL